MDRTTALTDGYCQLWGTGVSDSLISNNFFFFSSLWNRTKSDSNFVRLSLQTFYSRWQQLL